MATEPAIPGLELPGLEVPELPRTDTGVLDITLAKMARYPFRARFHLREPEVEFVALRGMGTVRAHADDLIGKRLAPAFPAKDGKQTPWGGHPVFRAQHATGTCCRSCLQQNHGISKGRELTPEQRRYVVDIICRWVELDARRARSRGRARA